MLNPKLSIIVPVFNAEKYLERCIKSILNQTYNNLEIILVNDGSTDKSLDICDFFAKVDSRISLISKINGGVASARNKGLEIASGEYIGFVDSDDHIDKYMYEKMVREAMIKEADIIECGYLTSDEEDNNKKHYQLNNQVIEGNYNCCYSYLKNENTTNFNVNKLYKSTIVNELRYPNYKYSEDYWFNSIAFFNCEKKVTIQDTLYVYVQNPDSAVNKQFNIKNKMDVFRAAEDIYTFYEYRYPQLQSLIALYICKYVMNYFYEIDKNDLKINNHYKKQMVYIFNKYYPKINGLGKKKIKFKATRIFLILFNIHPWMYLKAKKSSYILKRSRRKQF